MYLKTWLRGSTNNSPFIDWRRAFGCSSLKVKEILNLNAGK